MNYWLVKTEPDTYSFGDLIEKGEDIWDGVRNYQARNFLKEMKAGDKVLVYHSGKDKAVVGLSMVTEPAFEDPGDTEKKGWVAVKLKALESLKKPVPLEQIKKDKSLSDMLLVRQSRLSVMPLEKKDFEQILKIPDL